MEGASRVQAEVAALICSADAASLKVESRVTYNGAWGRGKKIPAVGRQELSSVSVSNAGEEIEPPIANSSEEDECLAQRLSPRSPNTMSTCAETHGHHNKGSGLSVGSNGDNVEAEGSTGEWQPDALESEECREANLRYFLTPLSREQLLDLLSWAALRDTQVHQRCAERVHSSPSSRRLMVRNVHFSTSDARFTSFFEGFGCLDDALIVRERDGQSRGYGFATFAEPESVNRCFEACPLSLDGRQLHVKLAADLFTSRDQTKLFVRNLADVTTAENLRQVFEHFGQLEECVVVRDADGHSKGYGFLNFSTPVEAFKAVQQSERIIDGRVVFIHFASSPASRGSARSHNQRNTTHVGLKGELMNIHRKGPGSGMSSNSHNSGRRIQSGAGWIAGSECISDIAMKGWGRKGQNQHRSMYLNQMRLPISRCIPGSVGDPLMYADGGYGDVYGFSVPTFPLMPSTQSGDIKAAIAPFFTYPVSPYYQVSGHEGRVPYGTMTGLSDGSL